MTIHNNVARLRKERGLSRKELADAVGVGSQTIGHVELHDYRILILRTTVVIVRALDTPFGDVFSTELFAAEVGHLQPLKAWIIEALAPFRETPCATSLERPDSPNLRRRCDGESFTRRELGS